MRKHKRYVLRNMQAPGDILMLTACVRDVKRFHPDIEIDVRVPEPSRCLFDCSPYITPIADNTAPLLEMSYPLIHRSNQDNRIHFLHGFIDNFNEQTGSSVMLTEFKPDVHLLSEELNTPVFPDLPQQFVLANCGHKMDFVAKAVPTCIWEEIFARLKNVTFIRVGSAPDGNNVQPEISAANLIDKVGQTDIRQLLRLSSQSVGVITPVSLPMHAAACFYRAACVLTGGFEPLSWEHYWWMNTFGAQKRLLCCKDGGCWASNGCVSLNREGYQRCMELLDIDLVCQTIVSWFTNQSTLSPGDIAHA